MANTQKEKLNSRRIKIKSDLEFGVINPLRYDINSKTLSLKIDDTLDIDDVGRLTVVPAEAYNWDINWHADDMPQNEGWTRNFDTNNWWTINKEELDSDGTKQYLSLDISKDTHNTAGGIITFEYYRGINLDLSLGYLIKFRTNFTSFVGGGTGTVQLFEIKNAQINTLIFFKSDYSTWVRIGADSDFDIGIDPRGSHDWKVLSYTQGGNTYIQLYVDGIIKRSSLQNTYGAMGSPLISFGNTMTSLYDNVSQSIINFEYVKVKLDISTIYTEILDKYGDIVGGEGYEWFLDIATINHNLSVGGDLKLSGSLTIDTLSGILRATTGVVAAITAGSANQILGITNAGTGYEYKTVEGTTNQVIITLSTANKIIISLPQNIHSGASPTFAGLTLSGLTGILKTSAGVISGSAALTDLSNIVITNIQDNDILQYDSATGKWINVVVPGGVETDPIVGAINGLVKANGAGVIGTVVSGTDIKTINSQSLLGSGDIAVSGADEKTKVSANDTTAGYLNGKLVAGSKIVLTENDDAGNETLTISLQNTGTSYSKAFTNADLVTGILTVTHNLSNKYCIVQIFDDNDIMILPDTITLIDTSSLTIDLTSYGAITGTWNVIVVINSVLNTTVGSILESQIFN